MLDREAVRSSFYVVLHDVTPRFESEIRAIVDALKPVIGTRMAAAVVPKWDDLEENRVTTEFAESVERDFGEVLLHGFTHRRMDGAGSVTWLTGACDEFNGYSHGEAHERVDEGQLELERVFGRRSSGFIAPTFQMGRLSLDRFPEHGLRYKVGFYSIDGSDGSKTPLATWCWDMGHLRFLGILGDFYGTARYRLRRNILPCLALHPVDVTRGFLDRIVQLVESLIKEGRCPLLMNDRMV